MIAYRKRRKYKYDLADDFTIYVDIYTPKGIDLGVLKLDTSGNLTILEGYAWDGPSGPAIDTESFMKGSLVHDALYQLIRRGYLGQCHRKKADKILRHVCLLSGMSRFRAWYVYKSVRIGAASSAKPDILYAP